ncbi:MAG: hypothetical protein WKG01_25870 [Kofleriaceae bacterium]
MSDLAHASSSATSEPAPPAVASGDGAAGAGFSLDGFLDDAGAAAGDAVDMLRDAIAVGAEEVVKVARSIPLPDLGAALQALPDAAYAMLQLLWPDFTGWSAHLEAGAAVTLAGTDIGLPGEIELDAGVSCEIAIRREGWKIVVSFEPSVEAGGAGVPSIKLLELPIGVSASGALAVELAVDLGKVTWPTGVLAMLFELDTKGAFALLATAAKIGKNTQATVGFQSGTKADITGEVGPDTLFEAALSAGLSLAGATTIKNPTEAEEGEVTCTGLVGAFGGLDLSALGGEGAVLSGDLADLAFELGETTNEVPLEGSAGVSGDVGLRLTIRLPATTAPSRVASFEIAIQMNAAAEGELLGQGAKGGASAEIVLGAPDIQGFIAAHRAGAGLGDQLLAAPISGVNATFTVGGSFHDYLGIFPKLASWFPELVDESTNQAELELALEVSATREDLQVMLNRGGSLPELIAEIIRTGDLQGSLYRHADIALENLADVVGMIDKLTLDAKVGAGRMFGVETPGAGDITGGEGEIGGSVDRIFHRELEAEDLGVPAVEAWLRDLIVGGS